MDELDASARGGPKELHFAVALYLLLGLVIAILASIPEVSAWGESLVLVGLSAMVTLAVLPEISLFRLRHTVSRLLMALLLLQIISGILVGSNLLVKFDRYRDDLWAPADLTLSEQLDEVFKMSIGVSEVDNLLPIVVWIIAFHCVFLSLMTGLSYWTVLPVVFTVGLGFLWQQEQGVGILGYGLVFVTVVCIGLEGVLRGYMRARRSGLPPSIFRQKVREVLLLSLIVMVAAPIMPDFRKLTPIESIWNLTEQGPSGAARGTLRFSTVFRFGGNLKPDYAPAFKVSASSPQLWRGMIFVNYTGRELLAENNSGRAYGQGQAIRSTYEFVVESTELEQNFTLLSSFPGVIFNAFEPSAVFGVDSFRVTESMALLREGSQSPGTNYTVLSRIVAPDADLLRTRAGSDGYGKYIQYPGSVPERVRELATNLTRGLDNSFDRAVAIAQYLKGMRYDLSARSIPPDRDVIDYFLFEMRGGYCQHFAAAMAVLCRAIGIPARVVTGFGSGTYSSAERAYQVLQLNFHAWVEVGFPGYGWVSFDPTPGGVGGPQIADAAEANAILGGVLPYYGSIQRRPTGVFVTGVPEYVSEELAFLIQGRVIEDGVEEVRGVPGVEMNVSMDVSGLDIFPANVMPTDSIPITMLTSRTRSDGSFSALCMLPAGVERVTRQAKLQVICLGNELYEISYANLTLPVLRRSFLSLRVLGENKSIAAGSLRSSSGPVADQPVRFLLDGEVIGSRATNASGMATILLDVGPGAHAISARFDGTDSLGPSAANLNFVVPGAGPPADDGGPRGWIYAVAALVAATAVSLLEFLRRQAAACRPESMTHLYHRMLEILGRNGIRRKPSMTPFEFADYAESRGASRGKVRELTTRFVEEAYGGRAAREGEIDLARTMLSELGKGLGGSQLRRLRRRTASALSRIL